MRLVYQLPVKPGAKVECAPGAAPIPLAIGDVNAEVTWRIEDGHLSDASLALLEQRVSPVEPITPPPELEEVAFRLAAYVANSILKQTLYDAIDYEEVLARSPELHAETKEEERILATTKRTVSVRLTTKAGIATILSPDRIDRSGAHAQALALYADGLRAEDPFVKFELFYRVMEYFFPNPQNHAPSHLRNWPEVAGQNFGEVRERVQRWHELRRRSVHPRPKRDAELRRDDLHALREMRKEAVVMQRAACWLLENPPNEHS